MFLALLAPVLLSRTWPAVAATPVTILVGLLVGGAFLVGAVVMRRAEDRDGKDAEK